VLGAHFTVNFDEVFCRRGDGDLPGLTLWSVFLQILYGVGFNQEDLKAAVPVIYSNVISSMQNLCKATQDFGIEVGPKVRCV
jgi:hypothetical protein